MTKLVAVGAFVLAALVSGCATGIVNKPPSDVTETSATVNGIVWTTDGGNVSYWVEYGTTTAYDRETTHQTTDVPGDKPHDVSIPLAGLTPSTTWHYRICAEDAQAGTCSKDATFFTGDSASGRAVDCLNDEPGDCFHPTFVDVDARSGPSGQNPVGQTEWESHIGTNLFIGGGGPAICLAVTGNVAIIGSGNQSSRTLIRVSDGGTAPGQDAFSATTEFYFPQPGPPVPQPDCSSYPPPPLPFEHITWTGSGTNEIGDLIVRDVTAGPTATGLPGG